MKRCVALVACSGVLVMALAACGGGGGTGGGTMDIRELEDSGESYSDDFERAEDLQDAAVEEYLNSDPSIGEQAPADMGGPFAGCDSGNIELFLIIYVIEGNYGETTVSASCEWEAELAAGQTLPVGAVVVEVQPL